MAKDSGWKSRNGISLFILEIEGAEPFIDIFDQIPAMWNKSFIPDAPSTQ